MDINNLCAPALLYVAFSVTQIIIDTYKRMYNTALVKIIVMIIFTFILNILCQRGLGIISWFIVFIPFITMTVITSILLITFGLHPDSGKKIHHKEKHHDKEEERRRHEEEERRRHKEEERRRHKEEERRRHRNKSY